MNKSQTPYACSICKKEFCQAIFLIKHVELRHTSADQSSTVSNSKIATTKSNSNIGKKGHSANSKNSTKSNDYQPYVIKVEEYEIHDEQATRWNAPVPF